MARGGCQAAPAVAPGGRALRPALVAGAGARYRPQAHARQAGPSAAVGMGGMGRAEDHAFRERVDGQRQALQRSSSGPPATLQRSSSSGTGQRRKLRRILQRSSSGPPATLQQSSTRAILVHRSPITDHRGGGRARDTHPPAAARTGSPAEPRRARGGTPDDCRPGCTRSDAACGSQGGAGAIPDPGRPRRLGCMARPVPSEGEPDPAPPDGRDHRGGPSGRKHRSVGSAHRVVGGRHRSEGRPDVLAAERSQSWPGSRTSGPEAGGATHRIAGMA